MTHDTRLPICAICGTAVNRLVVENDGWRQTTVFTVECHGKRERAEVTPELVRSVTRGQIDRMRRVRWVAPLFDKET